jgi:homoserine O-acetyltransferase
VAWNLFELMVDGPGRLTTAFAGPGDADNHIQNIAEAALKAEKVNDVIWEFDASRDYDPSSRPGLIQAPLLAVNFADDELNPVELGGLERAIAQVRRGRAVVPAAAILWDSSGVAHPAWLGSLRLSGFG